MVLILVVIHAIVCILRGRTNSQEEKNYIALICITNCVLPSSAIKDKVLASFLSQYLVAISIEFNCTIMY